MNPKPTNKKDVGPEDKIQTRSMPFFCKWYTQLQDYLIKRNSLEAELEDPLQLPTESLDNLDPSTSFDVMENLKEEEESKSSLPPPPPIPGPEDHALVLKDLIKKLNSVKPAINSFVALNSFWVYILTVLMLLCEFLSLFLLFKLIQFYSRSSEDKAQKNESLGFFDKGFHPMALPAICLLELVRFSLKLLIEYKIRIIGKNLVDGLTHLVQSMLVSKNIKSDRFFHDFQYFNLIENHIKGLESLPRTNIMLLRLFSYFAMMLLISKTVYEGRFLSCVSTLIVGYLISLKLMRYLEKPKLRLLYLQKSRYLKSLLFLPNLLTGPSGAPFGGMAYCRGAWNQILGQLDAYLKAHRYTVFIASLKRLGGVGSLFLAHFGLLTLFDESQEISSKVAILGAVVGKIIERVGCMEAYKQNRGKEKISLELLQFFLESPEVCPLDGAQQQREKTLVSNDQYSLLLSNCHFAWAPPSSKTKKRGGLNRGYCYTETGLMGRAEEGPVGDAEEESEEEEEEGLEMKENSSSSSGEKLRERARMTEQSVATRGAADERRKKINQLIEGIHQPFGGSYTLGDLNLNIKTGGRYFFYGPPKSGKSSLLSAFMGELYQDPNVKSKVFSANIVLPEKSALSD